MTPEQVTQRLYEVARWLSAQDTPNTNEARKDVLEGVRTVAELANFLELADNGMREQAARYEKDIRLLNARIYAATQPRSPRCDDCSVGDHSTHDRKNDCGNWIEYQCECRGPEILTDAEVAEWNHADCGDDCQTKAIEKLVWNEEA